MFLFPCLMAVYDLGDEFRHLDVARRISLWPSLSVIKLDFIVSHGIIRSKFSHVANNMTFMD